MIIKSNRETHEIKKDGIVFKLLQSGDIMSVSKDSIQINQLRGNYIDGTVSNIYLRIKDQGKYKHTPLIGVKSLSEFKCSDNEVIYKGEFEGIKYKLRLTVFHQTWFYSLNLKNSTNNKIIADVFYGQDVNIAGAGGNEAYVSQYIDHKAFESNNGYVVCSRQNMFKPSYLQIGSLTKNISFSTDGFQFFGKEYKTNSIPEALNNDRLESIIYQYEFAYICLQSDEIELIDESNVVFYGIYKDTHENSVTEIEFLDEVMSDYKQISSNEISGDYSKIPLSVNVDNVLNGDDLSFDEINKLYPIRHHEENDGELLSFFIDNKSHVVLKKKEQLVERPHGHIILNGDQNYIKENIYASTNFMYGIFNSQIVCGNTSFNKMISNARDALNLLKTSGQRIYVKVNNSFKILNMPSFYEIGLNYAKWLYKLDDEIITVTVYTKYENQEIVMDIKSNSNYDFLITNHMVMGVDEYDKDIEVSYVDNSLIFIVNKDTFTASRYENLTFQMLVDQDFEIHNDSIFYDDELTRNEPLVNLLIKNTNSINVKILADIDGNIIDSQNSDLEVELQKFIKYYSNNLNDFQVTINNEYSEDLDKFNYLAYWYTHNALIHYSSPHGLEQYGGAAWGTRDVCQGPFEYFLTTQKFEVCREIINKVYEHQFIDNGDWPQWFMFDRFTNIQAGESHGDIIVWPLRSLALYLKATGDYSVLEEELCYVNKDDFRFTEEKETLLMHILKQMKTIKQSFITGTYLSSYGDGDWDDTLQPANLELRKNMVSGWTTALTFETFRILGDVLPSEYSVLKEELNSLSENIKNDYKKYVIKDNIPAGFLLFDNDKIKYIIHPEDKETGLKYRLLPINRCFISELFDKDDVENYYNIVKEYLYHPDGVRLMNTTAKYKGGVNTYFKRAEQAANFGREIGLQYVHAHIRFIEAMANIGYKDEVFKGLLRINPINIKDNVPNAEIRQSNCYFSSSDAKFNNRYEAMKNFDKLRTGDIKVKGGWRVYSSGPGIYLNQMISNFLGIKIHFGNLLIDPQIPEYLDGLEFKYKYMDKEILVKYIIKKNDQIKKVLVNDKEVEFTFMDNNYRSGGAVITKDILDKILTNEVNQISIIQ